MCCSAVLCTRLEEREEEMWASQMPSLSEPWMGSGAAHALVQARLRKDEQEEDEPEQDCTLQDGYWDCQQCSEPVCKSCRTQCEDLTPKKSKECRRRIPEFAERACMGKDACGYVTESLQTKSPDMDQQKMCVESLMLCHQIKMSGGDPRKCFGIEWDLFLREGWSPFVGRFVPNNLDFPTWDQEIQGKCYDLCDKWSAVNDDIKLNKERCKFDNREVSAWVNGIGNFIEKCESQ